MPHWWKPSSWSYRVKVPLVISLVAVTTALAVSVAIALSARHWLQVDLRDHAGTVAESLARGLVVNIARDDVWEAFEAVRAVAAADGGAARCEIIVLDKSDRVFVSSDPLRYRIGSLAQDLTPAFFQAAKLKTTPGKVASAIVNGRSSPSTVVSTSLLSVDKETMGRLLINYSHAVFSQRYRDTISALAGITLGLVVLLIPLGWYLGQRLTAPVARVTDTLYRLGEEAARHSTAYAITSAVAPNALAAPNSELARLEHSLDRLQQQLEEKEQLQHQFVAADRLAAIGRMTSVVAHEINNPLAGMLNALSNLRKDPSLLQKTVSLLERGLEQIRQTLSALLIETKTGNRPLSPEDIEDLRLLVNPQTQRKNVTLVWDYPIDGELPVPAAPVRQIVLNLLLNAVQASSTKIEFSAQTTPSELIIRVINDGTDIPQTRLERPFEANAGEHGHGLGLWASHQLVTSLGGQIAFTSEVGRTMFVVHLPLHHLPKAGEATQTHPEHSI